MIELPNVEKLIEVTEIEEKVLNYFHQYQEEQARYPLGPSYRQIARACNLSGPGRAYQIVRDLRERELIKEAPNREANRWYAIKLTEALVKQGAQENAQ